METRQFFLAVFEVVTGYESKKAEVWFKCGLGQGVKYRFTL